MKVKIFSVEAVNQLKDLFAVAVKDVGMEKPLDHEVLVNSIIIAALTTVFRFSLSLGIPVDIDQISCIMESVYKTAVDDWEIYKSKSTTIDKTRN